MQGLEPKTGFASTLSKFVESGMRLNDDHSSNGDYVLAMCRYLYNKMQGAIDYKSLYGDHTAQQTRHIDELVWYTGRV